MTVLWAGRNILQKVKPHRKKKLRTLATDLNLSNDYDNYISQLDSLPKLEAGEQPRVAAAPRVGRKDSSEDEALVGKLSSSVPTSEGGKAKGTGELSFCLANNQLLL